MGRSIEVSLGPGVNICITMISFSRKKEKKKKKVLLFYVNIDVWGHSRDISLIAANLNITQIV